MALLVGEVARVYLDRQNMSQRIVVFAVSVFLMAPPTASGAQSAQSAAAKPAVAPRAGEPRELARGVRTWTTDNARGPWRMYVVEVDLRKGGATLRTARALDSLRGRESVQSIAARSTARGDTVLAAVNADFFNVQTGENENNQVMDGEWWKGLKVTDSPYDTYDNVHVQFAIGSDGRLVMDRFILDGKAWARGTMTPIIAVNANPTGNPEGTALYTLRYGRTTPRDTARVTSEVSLRAVDHRGDTIVYVRVGAARDASGSVIPADGAVLAGYASRAKEVAAMTDGDTVRVLLTTLPRMPNGKAPALLVGGWPRILRDGVNVAGDAATVEGTISRNAEVRHPRTSIGYSRDGKKVWLMVVDGRSKDSAGMTLIELADAMRALGAYNAINFDGGGSSTIVINGKLVNVPSDAAGERNIGNAMMVVLKRRGQTH